MLLTMSLEETFLSQYNRRRNDSITQIARTGLQADIDLERDSSADVLIKPALKLQKHLLRQSNRSASKVLSWSRRRFQEHSDFNFVDPKQKDYRYGTFRVETPPFSATTRALGSMVVQEAWSVQLRCKSSDQCLPGTTHSREETILLVNRIIDSVDGTDCRAYEAWYSVNPLADRGPVIISLPAAQDTEHEASLHGWKEAGGNYATYDQAVIVAGSAAISNCHDLLTVRW